MKLRYTFFAVILVILFGMLALAGTGGLKNDFFSAESVFDADDLKLFEGSFKRGKITKYDFDIKDGDHSVGYTVWTEDFKSFFLESKKNFDFVIKCDKSVSELNIPWGLIEYFHNCQNYNRKYSSLYDGIIKVLSNNTDESDFSLRTSIIDYNGLKRQNNVITLELDDSADVTEDLKKYLSSGDIAEMLNELYGADCTAEQLGELTEKALKLESGSLSYKRSIVSGIAHEESLSVTIDDNVFDLKVKNNVKDDISNGSITISDKKKTVDFSLEFAKNAEGESVALKNGDAYTEIKAKDKNSITYFSKNGDLEMKVTVSSPAAKSISDNVYDATVASRKNLMLCELTPWLNNNGNAAILFKTYEVGIKPLKIDLEELKINFDE